MGATILRKRALVANEEYEQSLQDRFQAARPVGFVRGEVYADKAGILYLEESDDAGENWSTTTSVSVSAGVTDILPWTKLTKRWYRFRYANGAAAQESFVLIQQTEGLDFVLRDSDGKLQTNSTVTLGDVSLEVGSDPLPTTLTGSYVGYSTDTKPTISNYTPGTEITFLELDTGDVYVYDGTDWVVLA